MAQRKAVSNPVILEDGTAYVFFRINPRNADELLIGYDLQRLPVISYKFEVILVVYLTSSLLKIYLSQIRACISDSSLRPYQGVSTGEMKRP